MWKWSGLAFVVLALAACARTPDEQAIRANIEAMAEAAEARRGKALLEHISEDFVGNDGTYDRDGLANLIRAQFLAGQAVGVHPGRVEVEVDGSRAIARFPLRVDDASGRWLPDRRANLDVTTGWRREGRDWVCYNAKWTRRD
ncbi:MAG: DUF4440 domain-containing protein [Xanthomonadales bacterium]|nr:DUF4440 domain-containing protein [Xanthomonadales bacterium]